MSGHVARDVALIVNPSAGGGRAARALPAVEARLLALGLAVEVDATRDLGHACELAVGAAQRGRVVVTLSGDGMLGAVAGALRAVPGAVVGVLPGGRGNDFARVAGIPLDAEAACDVIAGGTVRAIDLGLAGDHPYIGIASLGFDSDANRIANEAPSRLGQLVYLYGALRALAAWKPAAFTVEVDGERVQFSGWSVAAGQLQGLRGRDAARARRRARRRCARRGALVADEQAPLPAHAAEGVQGRARARSQRARPARRRGPRGGRPPVRRVRRRRPGRRAADDLPRPARRAAGPATGTPSAAPLGAEPRDGGTPWA